LIFKNKMNQITIKKDVINSLISYEPRFEKFGNKKHELNKINCAGMIKRVLMPINKKIKDDIMEDRKKNQYRFITDKELIQAKDNCKFLLGVFRTCQKADIPFSLSFADQID